MKYHIEFDLDFKRNPYRGRYFVIEGIDGSGKTTQAKCLCDFFKKSNIQTILTCEPRKKDGVVGELIQKILLSKINIPPVAFQYLFSAERAIHHEELIIPSLKAGKHVVSDRSFWSAIPYGIMDKMMSADSKNYDFKEGEMMLVAQSILSMYHQFLVPNITFYLKISINTAMKRITAKTDGKEIYEKKDILEKVVKGYDWLVEKFPEEFVVIDGEKEVERVTEEITKRLKV
ncbi:MAG: dTMP kinase [Candidatus Levyibacteriota bacterium]